MPAEPLRQREGTWETHRVGGLRSLTSNLPGGLLGAQQPRQELQGVAFGQRGVGEGGLHPRCSAPSLKAGDPAGGKIKERIPGTSSCQQS